MPAAETTKQILIVDRDVAAVEPLRVNLSEAGFLVRSISDGAAAAAAVAERPPHLVILDWNSPGFTAFDLIQRICAARARQAIRLIILSALAGEQDVVDGLSFGADDYIAKPFAMREVVARVGAVLRPRRRDSPPSILSCDSLVLETSTSRVTAHGQEVELRGVEYRLLEFLMSNIGRPFNRAQLLAELWSGDMEVDERIVDVNVQHLRKILKGAGFEAYIRTVRGFGYRFLPPTPASTVASAGAQKTRKPSVRRM